MFDGDVGETILFRFVHSIVAVVGVSSVGFVRSIMAVVGVSLVGFVHSIVAVVGVSIRSSSEIILIGMIRLNQRSGSTASDINQSFFLIL